MHHHIWQRLKGTERNSSFYYESRSIRPNTVEKGALLFELRRQLSKGKGRGVFEISRQRLPAANRRRGRRSVQPNKNPNSGVGRPSTDSRQRGEATFSRAEQNEDVGNPKYRADRANRMPPVTDSHRFRAHLPPFRSSFLSSSSYFSSAASPVLVPAPE